MGTKEIDEVLPVSFTDIGKVLKDEDKENEAEQQRIRQEFLSRKPANYFMKEKVLYKWKLICHIIFQRGYWALEGLHNLNRIYEEIKGDTWHLVNLCKSI
jgi:hypothetical protein